jgi:hypothetical protein
MVTVEMSTALAPGLLVGLDLWDVTFALDMMMIQFGKKRKVPTKRDPEREVGEYALHVECPHETLENGAPADLRLLLASRGPMKVQSVREEPLGSLELVLDGGVLLRVIGDPHAPDDADNDGEQWRLLIVGGDHLVFTGGRYRIE